MSMHKFDFRKLIIAVVACEAVGYVGALFTAPAVSTWYAGLNKPVFAPPDFIFGPVWIALYFLMGLGLYIVWYKGIENVDTRRAIALFAFQLSLNLLWTGIFFGAKDIGLAFAEIIALWIVVVLTIVEFGRISRKPAALMFPYLAWVSFATFLNYAFWLMNG
ncbi:TspO/MBR family protein [uncultured archaeon]|nr:TspO/MBR family protein [uncultured archaeon]